MNATPVDLAIVGAGIVGLAHAVEAVSRGLSVVVIERDERAVGASVRNFGHACITAQAGEALTLALEARGTWLRMGRTAGFDVAECGTVVATRSKEERQAVEELAAERGTDEVVLLSAQKLKQVAPIAAESGAFFPRDLRVDQRRAAGALAAWLQNQPGVRVQWSNPVLGVEPGLVRTGRGEIRAERIVVCAGHNLDRLLPGIADEAGLQRCVLQMLQLRAPGLRIEPAVLTGSSMLRYPALAATAGAKALRERWSRERPEMLGAVVNHMLTQLPDGDLVVGDTHAYARTHEPFSDEALDDLMLAETRDLLKTDLTVVRRWRGVYAGADGEFLRAPVAPGVMAVAVTSGIGMTTAFGLAPTVLDLMENS
ncbi:TIGR03364 family FAD-dependent oxidoreductase [Paractinoplanes lichenicola]|uniref:TIGR03364 family FAD-dependent oxidoreductase n=1 Tax=Paractinoplanes lichenicola TaxID=2802976 RepID=A0ABS1W646_9ACTN|nr:TIGR03364 family FAD-dependent oxidoreductase [Actinoplanes lichenicola]MBL7262209.1 TIGR03364 family FAD-dependent oxidoreductase [Actinoplanes lichenicola]